jgi:hypothetical protein
VARSGRCERRCRTTSPHMRLSSSHISRSLPSRPSSKRSGSPGWSPPRRTRSSPLGSRRSTPRCPPSSWSSLSSTPSSHAKGRRWTHHPQASSRVGRHPRLSPGSGLTTRRHISPGLWVWECLHDPSRVRSTLLFPTISLSSRLVGTNNC